MATRIRRPFRSRKALFSFDLCIMTSWGSVAALQRLFGAKDVPLCGIMRGNVDASASGTLHVCRVPPAGEVQQRQARVLGRPDVRYGGRVIGAWADRRRCLGRTARAAA